MELPVNPELLNRPRINEMLLRAVSYPLVSILAGPGYGKTQALSRFVKKFPCRLIWLHITNFDNLTSHFWDTFLDATGKELPRLSEKLHRIGFPYRPQDIDMVSRLIAQEAAVGEKVIFVVDDYSSLTNVQIKAFFAHLLDCEFKKLSLVIVCSERSEIFSSPVTSRNFYTISAEDLRFTLEETSEIFLQNGIDNVEAVRAVYSFTEGWPVAVNLTLRQLKSRGVPDFDSLSLDLSSIADLFELNYFRNYEPVYQHLLVRLALIEGFSLDMLRYILDEVGEAGEILRKNMFIYFDANKRLYIPQLMYRTFLLQKKYLLSHTEITAFYNTAGIWFSENRYLNEAVDCYTKAGNFQALIKTFQLFPHRRLEKDMVLFYQSHLDQFDSSYFETMPCAQQLRASLYLNNFEVSKAQEAFEHLRDRLEREIDTRGEENVDTETLGEAYLSLGEICIVKCRDCFHHFFKKACYYLPNGSRVRGTTLLYADNNSFLFFDSKEAGSGEKLEQLFFEMIPYMKTLRNGCGEGLAYLYAAELAYNSYNFTKTQEMAYQAIYISEDIEHDVYCNACFILMRLALVQGDYDQARTFLNQIVTYIGNRNLTNLYNLRDSVESYFYIKMEDMTRVSQWMRDGADLNTPPISVGRAQSIRTLYLLRSERYYEALALLSQLNITAATASPSSGFWVEILYRKFFRALTLLRIGEKDRALEAFWDAYNMAYGNNLITIFIEAGSITRTLIENAKKSTRFDFDEKWLDNVYQKASTCAKHLATVRSKYREKTNQSPKSTIRLTKRELEVLRSMSQGLTREEIGDFLGISVNGVKNHIKGIYNKLGAINRSDAIYIATQQGILE